MLEILDKLAGAWLQWRTARQTQRMNAEEGLQFKKAEIDEQGFYAEMISPVVAQLANEAAAMLNHANAKNYVQFDMMPRIDKSIRPVRVTVQWAHGLSPAAKAARYQAALQDIVNYRERAGALGFQLEKLDDLIRAARVLLELDAPAGETTK